MSFSTVAEVQSWYESFNGLTEAEAIAKLPQEALADCEGDVEQALGYVLAQLLDNVLGSAEEVDAEVFRLVMDCPCRLSY